MTKTWWKEAVIYQIYPRSFKDSNGDGIGDLKGITQKLDYLALLGVDVLWLSPIFKSPNDDNGYDVSDYCAIMQEFGTMVDFDELLEKAHNKGLKIILDLVVNHSSDEHAWFQASRQSADNPYSDYYIWEKERPNNWQSFFGGDAWEYDEQRQAYFLHLFTKKQPDLNWENPKVREEVYKLMRFWYDKGVDGFRMDVIPLISKRPGFPDAPNDDFENTINNIYSNGPRVHEFLQEMTAQTNAHYDVMTVGEGIGVSKENCLDYVGSDRKELDMLYHFDHLFLGYEGGDRLNSHGFTLIEVKQIFREWQEAIGDAGWLNICLDNHDFARMVSRFGNDQEYRVAAAKLLATLLLSQKGTPCIYQGSEIGMTNVAFPSIEDYDDVANLSTIAEWRAEGKDMKELLRRIQEGGRDNARTPVQWDNTSNAGFTTGEPWLKVNPNYSKINVANALADTDSIFYYYQKMLSLRKQHKTLVYGAYREYLPNHPEIYFYERTGEEKRYLVLLNFSDTEQVISGVPDFSKALLLIGNYETVNNTKHLAPWEARVYEIT